MSPERTGEVADQGAARELPLWWSRLGKVQVWSAERPADNMLSKPSYPVLTAEGGPTP